ncbi:MAG: zinc ribbon domain-containing protein [Immundisolibacteraceae bacterium]|nr:zinc ribbon domain-containing protein [Immundisolibacteraceae bacterium]
MPIYEYHCLECDHTKDVLQKLSDPLLTVCPACEKSSFSKKVSAPGFQLKGTGWYETDFKDKPASKGDSDSNGSSNNDGASKTSKDGDSQTKTEKPASTAAGVFDQ